MLISIGAKIVYSAHVSPVPFLRQISEVHVLMGPGSCSKINEKWIMENTYYGKWSPYIDFIWLGSKFTGLSVPLKFTTTATELKTFRSLHGDFDLFCTETNVCFVTLTQYYIPNRFSIQYIYMLFWNDS